MTLSSGTNRQQHVGNGSTKAFAFSYQYRAAADLRVILTVGGVETVQSTPAHYSISPDGGDAGTVTFVTAPPGGAQVTIICDEPVNQPLAVSTIQSFKSQGFQSGLDHLARIGRRAIDMAARSLRLRESDTPGAGAYDVGGNRLTNLAASSAPSDAARKDELTALAGSLAPVATSGAYADLTGKPSLGTAAAQNVEAFATAAQGSKADTAVQPAGLTKAAVGLGNVDNTSDANKPVSTAQAAALALKANTSSLGTAAGLNTGTTAGTIPLLGTGGVLPAVGGANLTGMNKSQVGLSNVDNTSDLAKPVSTLMQAALDLKASTSSLALVATSGAYADLSGKPTLGTAAALNTGTASGNIPLLGASGLPAVGASLLTGLTKAQVGLGNVDNTSDATKNAATATLTNKTLTAPVINSPTGLVKADVGLGNVDNTSDANKPVSTATQAALNAKAPLNSPVLVDPTLSARPATSDNSALIPDTKWVNDAIAGAVASGVADGDKGDIVVSGSGSVWTLDAATAAALKDRANQTGTQAVSTITGLATVATSGAYGDLSAKPTLGTAAALNTGTSSGNIPLLGASGLPAVGGSLLTGLTKAQVGLGSVDNTADSAKPVSTAQLAALNLKADISSLASVATSGAYGDLSGRPTLGTAAALNTGTSSGNVPLLGGSGLPAVGGSLLTGLTKSQVGLGNVDNTSDASKPVSTAQAAADNLRLLIADLDTARAWTKRQRSTALPLTSSTAISVDLTAAQDFDIAALAHNTVITFSGMASALDQKGSITGKNNGTGGFTVGYGAGANPVGRATAPPIPTGANNRWRIDYHVRLDGTVDFTVSSVGV